MSTQMRRVADLDEVADPKPGDFEMSRFENPSDRRHGVVEFICPNGRRCGVTWRDGQAHPASLDTVWGFSGTLDQPTLTPSLNCVRGCGWHGFVRDGHLVDA